MILRFCLLALLTALVAHASTVDVKLTPCESPSALPAAIAAWPALEVRPAKWGYFPAPEYPPELERCGVKGTVEVEFAVNEHGWVVYAGVVKATDLRFAEAVLLTLRWFAPNLPKPATCTAGRYRLPINFNVAADSVMRDPKITANIITQPTVSAPKPIVRAADFEPNYISLSDTQAKIAPGILVIEAFEKIGPPKMKLKNADGTVVWFYGADLGTLDTMIVLSGERVFAIQRYTDKGRQHRTR